MADRDRPPHQVHVRPQHRHDAGMKTLLPKRGPTANQVVAVITLLPVGGTLLCLAGLIFIGTLIGLAVATPLFVIFSPILVPAAITIGLAVTAFVTSGAFGYTGLSTIGRVSGTVPQQLDYAKRSMQEMAVQMGQKTKEMGQAIQSKVQEAGKEGGGRT